MAATTPRSAASHQLPDRVRFPQPRDDNELHGIAPLRGMVLLHRAVQVGLPGIENFVTPKSFNDRDDALVCRVIKIGPPPLIDDVEQPAYLKAGDLVLFRQHQAQALPFILSMDKTMMLANQKFVVRIADGVTVVD